MQKFVSLKSRKRPEFPDDPEMPDSNQGKPDSKDDPRVRAFMRCYTYSMVQEGDGIVSFTINDLRKFFGAFISVSGFDPLEKLLKQLEANGYPLECDKYENRLVLSVKRVSFI